MQAHRRHDISDRVWDTLKPHLPGAKAQSVAPQQTIGYSSTRSFGYSAQAHLGATSLQIMDTGKTRNADSADGETAGCGKGCWRS